MEPSGDTQPGFGFVSGLVIIGVSLGGFGFSGDSLGFGFSFGSFFSSGALSVAKAGITENIIVKAIGTTISFLNIVPNLHTAHQTPRANESFRPSRKKST